MKISAAFKANARGPAAFRFRKGAALLALGLAVLLAQTWGHAAVQPTEALPYTTGWLLTGDYMVGNVDIQAPKVGTTGVGTINFDAAHQNVVPANADILAAFLYLEVIADAATTSQQLVSQMTFRGQPLMNVRVKATSQDLAGATASCFTSGVPVKMTMIRADVLELLPKQTVNGKPTGRVLVNDADMPTVNGVKQFHTITAPENAGNNPPDTAGASLVVVYRNPAPNTPLKRIVLYDGLHIAPQGEITQQTIRGFYKSAIASAASGKAKLTHIVGTGAKTSYESLTFQNQTLLNDPFPDSSKNSDRAWAAVTVDVSQKMNNPSPSVDGGYGEAVKTQVTHSKTSPYECPAWAAILFSTTIQDVDGDGIPDAVEDGIAVKDPPTRFVNGVPDPSSAKALPNLNAMGASSGHKDILFEINAMTTGPTSYGNSQAAGNVANATDSPYKWEWDKVNHQPIIKTPTLPDATGHNHMPTPDVLKMVGDAYKFAPAPMGPITAHFDVGDNDAYRLYASSVGTLDVHAADEYLVPTAQAKGGELIAETATPTSLFPAWPGTIGWGFGIQHAMYAPVGANGEELTGQALQDAETVCQSGGVCRRRFDLNRDGLFHYMLYSHARGKRKSPMPCLDTNGLPTASVNGGCLQSPAVAVNPDYNVPTSSSGVSDLPGFKGVVALGRWAQPPTVENPTPPSFVATPLINASTFLHEAGHQLGLFHGGSAQEPNCKPNYLSSMSYLFQLTGLIDPFSPSGLPKPDYSRKQHQPLDELNLSNPFLFPQTYSAAWYAPWVEPNPDVPGDLGSFGYQFGAKAKKYCNGVQFGVPEPPAMARVDGNGLAAPDWNGPGVPVNSQDVNFDGYANNPSNQATKLQGYDDWANIQLNQVGAGHVMGLVSSGGSDFGGSDFGGSDFGGSDFGGSDFGGSDFGGSDFGGSDFGGLDFEGSDFGGSDFGGSDFGGSDFGGAELDYETAAALGFTPPTGLHACVLGSTCPGPQPAPGAPTYHRVKLTWNQPGFGSVAMYHVIRYRVDALGHKVSPNEVGTGTTPAQDQCTLAGQVCTTVDNEELPNGQQFAYVVKAAFTDGSKSAASQSSETITAVNDAPVAHDLAFFAYEDTDLTGDLLANVTDDDTSITPITHVPLRAVLTSTPLHGVVKSHGVAVPLNGEFDGTFTFVPAADFENSPDAFTYEANDGKWSKDTTVSMSPDSNPPSTVTISAIYSRHTTTAVQPTSPSIYGNSVTFTATVTGDSGDTVGKFGKPAGSLTIKIDGAQVVTGPPDASGQLTYSTSSLTATNGGDHTVLALYCAGDPALYCPDHIYYGSQGSITHHVNPRPVTVNAVAASKTYGAADPPLTTTNSNFVASDLPPITFSATRGPGENVPGYVITPTASDGGTGRLGNYNVTYNTANFVINKAHLRVTANNTMRFYGDPNPAFTATLTGFQFNETLATSGVQGGAQCASPAAPTSPVPGPYGITCGIGSLNASNYDFTPFIDGALTVLARPITITADAKRKTVGHADPGLTYQITSGSLIAPDAFAGSLTRDSGEGVGTYAILQGGVSLTSNYALTYVGNNFTIAPDIGAAIGNHYLVAGDGESVVYDQHSTANSNGSTNPGLTEMLGTLSPGGERKDFYEIITNPGPDPVTVSQVELFGNVSATSTAVLVPVVQGTVVGAPGTISIPDRTEANRLAAKTVDSFSGDQHFTIVFDTPVVIPAGGQIAFGFIVPMVESVEATFYGTDTIPNSVSGNPPYWNGFYLTILQ